MYTQKGAEYSAILWAFAILVTAVLSILSRDLEFAIALARTLSLVGVMGTGTMVAFGLLGDLLDIFKLA